MRAWHEAQTVLDRCCSICPRIVSSFPSAFLDFSSGISGGGGGGGVPSSASRIHLPRCTTDVRLGYDVTVRTLPWPSSPKRFGSVSVTRRNCEPYTRGMP